MTERAFAIGENGQRASVARQELHGLMERAEVVAIESIPWSSNYTFATRLETDGVPPFLAVYKPRRGEIPLWDFPDGTLYRRERAAYLACVAIGWDFIPPTIIRDGPHGVGSFQLLIDADQRADFLRYKDQHLDQVQTIALFDVIANNADRKAGHCLRDGDGKIWGIDHGLTFNTAPKLRTILWDWQGEAIPTSLRTQLEAFRRDPKRVAALRADLNDLLTRSEVEAFLKRIDQTLQKGRFPPMSSRRGMPWPWY
ncbi:MAG: SCO1664 family protein [Chloroflexi bacterium]|nr:SCO1664 family protein [Chloroflexota bacterium]